MARMRCLVVAATALWALSGAALASGDSSCYATWKLTYLARDCASRAIIAPSNDTRINMLLLMRDRAGQGTSGLAYPKDGWNASGFGHTFFDWGMLKDGLFPARSATSDSETTTYAGSRCDSLSGGTAAFSAALAANASIPATERDKLAGGRARLTKICEIDTEAAASAQRYHLPGQPAPAPSPPLPDWPGGITSAAGKAFLGYLQSSAAFYAGDWGAARSGFAALARAPDPWLSETAAYMAARVELNAAMAGSIDEYGSYKGTKSVDQTSVGRARAALAAYLARWPQGRYASSAQGLQRRALWLSGDTSALSREYERLMIATGGGDLRAALLVEEIDNKLLYPDGAQGDAMAQGPLLLATQDLAAMRYAVGDDVRDDSHPTPPAFALAKLTAQRGTFAGQSDLWTYLQASHAFYIARDYRAVLGLLPDDAKRPSYAPLAFSRQMLRGMALAALGDRSEGGFWLDLLHGATGLWQRPTIELGLAMNYERHGKLAAVFAPGSPITDSEIRMILLAHSAGEDILRAQALDTSRPATERNVALFTLLDKDLSHGDYAGFITHSSLTVPKIDDGAAAIAGNASQQLPNFTKGTWSDGYACPALIETVRKLARNPQDYAARLCLGDFWRLNGFDPSSWDQAPPKSDELGGFDHEFPGKPTSRGPIYAAIIADPSAPAGEKAYALYRAVNCYGPSGSNGCGGADVPLAQRRAWFQQLKLDYAASQWAKQLRYYW